MSSTFETNPSPVADSLSFAEELLWRTEHGTTSLPFLECPRHLALAVRLSGPLDVSALARSIGDIVQRHEVLRSRFILHDGHVMRIVSPDLEPPLAVTAHPDLTRVDTASATDADEYRGVQQDLARAEVNAPFTLHGGPLLRVRLITFAETENVLVVTMHHLVADGWSLRIFARELEAGYASYALGRPTSLPPVPGTYRDYVAWQRQRLRSAIAAQLVESWSEQVAGMETTTIPGDLVGSTDTSTRAARHSFELAATVVERLRHFAVTQKTTIGVAALSSFMAAVAHASGRREVVVGVPLWDRGRPAFEELIGLFMNALPLRVTVPEHGTATSLLLATRDELRRVARYSSLPYGWLCEQQIGGGAEPAEPFRIVFNFAAIEGIGITLPGMTSERIDVVADTPAVADISLHIFERGQRFAGLFIYKADLYSPEFIASLADRYTQLVAEHAHADS